MPLESGARWRASLAQGADRFDGALRLWRHLPLSLGLMIELHDHAKIITVVAGIGGMARAAHNDLQPVQVIRNTTLRQVDGRTTGGRSHHLKPHVFVAMPLAGRYLDQLREHCDVEVFSATQPISPEELAAAIGDADGVLGSAQLLFPTEILDRAPRLRVICNVGVGYDNVDLGELSRRGIALANTPGVLSDAVADLVLGLMIAVARHLRECETIVREGRWGEPGLRIPLGSDLRGKTLSIVGMGRIGREVAARAAAFKMRVLCFDTRPDLVPPPFAERAATLDDALRAGDFISLHVDLNPASRHLIGPREFGLMKASAFLINAARGAVVDQRALYDVLAAQRIAGAGLDVLESEPPTTGDLLLQLDNVFIVPHIGSATVETRAAMVELAIENLVACVTGQPCVNIVNAEAAVATKEVSP